MYVPESRRDEELDVIPTDSATEKPMGFEIGETFLVRSFFHSRQVMQRRERLLSAREIASGEFAQDDGVHSDLALFQPLRKAHGASAKMTHPHRSVGQDHSRARCDRRRGGISRFGMVAPRRARRRAASRSIKA